MTAEVIQEAFDGLLASAQPFPSHTNFTHIGILKKKSGYLGEREKKKKKSQSLKIKEIIMVVNLKKWP